MNATIEIALRTREVFKLFERKINGDRLFINAVLHKFNLVMKQYKQAPSSDFLLVHQIEQAIYALTQQFSDNVNRFEEILEKKICLSGKKVSFITQFHTIIIVNNPLTMRLIEFIEIYDKLISVIKLLHLAGSFTTESDYYANIKLVQTLSNQMLSGILFTPSFQKIAL